MQLYLLNVTLHVIAALLWLGGMLFFALIASPVLRTVEPPDLRALLFRRLGEHFRVVGWVAIAVLLGTGLMNLRFRGWLGTATLGQPEFWTTMSGRSLLLKFACVAIMILLSAVYDFWIGPLALEQEPGSPRAVRLRRTASWLARLNAIVGLVVVYFAIRLTRGV